MRFRFLASVSVFFLVALPLQAETLQEAMMRAYKGSSSINKQRAILRGVDEKVPLAKSGARPSADFNASAGYSSSTLAGTQSDLTPHGFGITVAQPIYKGGRIDADVESAENSVRAQRAALVAAEQELFQKVVAAYAGVARDQEVLRLNRKNEEVLRQELQAARDRLKVGEATRTDSAQAESRYSAAVADRVEAEGKLAIAKATYERVTRQPPSELSMPKAEFTVPATLDDVLARAKENHPSIIAAQFSEKAAESDVDSATGALLPEVKVEAAATRNWETSGTAKGQLDNGQVMARMTLPLYRAGADYAKIRAAKETASQRRIEIREATNAVRENAVRAWENYIAAKATIKARQAQVSAAALAYEGVKQESQVGTRTVLDRLNAEAEHLQARVNLVQAQHDYVAALFDVKAAMGELTVGNLDLPVMPYDPEQHYNDVKDAWIGTTTDEQSGWKSAPAATVGVETEEADPAMAEEAVLLPEEKKKK